MSEKIVVNGETGQVERRPLSAQEATDLSAQQQALQTAETTRQTALGQRRTKLLAAAAQLQTASLAGDLNARACLVLFKEVFAELNS